MRRFHPRNKHKIPSLLDLGVHLSKRRPYDSLAAIATDCLSDFFGDGDTDAVIAQAIFAGIGNDQRMDSAASFIIKAPEISVEL